MAAGSDGEGDVSVAQKWWRAVALAAVLAVGIGMRVYRFSTPGLWIDEFISYWAIEDGGLVETATRCFRYAATPPLYFFVLKGSVALFGVNEWGMRLPSVAFGSGLLVGVFLMGRRLFGFEGGVLAAGLAGLHPQLIFQSQNARMYSLSLVLGLVCVWSVLSILRGEGRRRAYVVYVLSGAALFYTHYLFVNVIVFANVAYVVWWLRERRGKWGQLWKWAALNAGLGAALAGGAAVLLGHREGVEMGERVALGDVLEAGVNVLRLQYVVVAALVTGLVEYARGSLGEVRWTPGEKGREGIGFATYWYAVTAGVIFAGALAVDGMLLWDRYSVMSAVGGTVLVGGALSFIEPRRTRLTMAVVLAALLVMPRVSSVREWGVFSLSHGVARGWRDVLREADDEITGKDVMFVQSTMVETLAEKGLLESGDETLQRYLCAPGSTFYLSERPELRALPWEWEWKVITSKYAGVFRRTLRERGRLWVACGSTSYFKKLEPDGGQDRSRGKRGVSRRVVREGRGEVGGAGFS